MASPPRTSKLAKPILIGVGGPSCSGKSTLTNHLSILLNAKIVHQDLFYKPDQDIPLMDGVMDGVAHWDCPDAIDNDLFLNHLLLTLQNELVHGVVHAVGPNRPKTSGDLSPKTLLEIAPLVASIHSLGHTLVLVDGFLIYHSLKVVSLFTVKLFLRASFATLKQRREARQEYMTQGGTWRDPEGYFEQVVWPSYLKYNRHVIGGIVDDEATNGDGRAWTVLDSEEMSIEESVALAVTAIEASLRTAGLK